MKIFILTVLLSVAASAQPFEPKYTCDEFPGRKLCHEMRKMDNLFVGCTGAACYTLWSSQLRQINNLEETYLYDFSGSMPFGECVTDLAAKVAVSLCATEVTADPSTIQTLVIYYNRLADLLEIIQKQGDVLLPVTCEFN